MEFAHGWLRNAGVPVEFHRFHEKRIFDYRGVNVVGALESGNPGPTVVVNGHLDTVKLCEGWTRDPYAASIEGDRMYGLGACDMKTGCASIMLALAAFFEDYPQFRGRIDYSLVCDEEGPFGLGTDALIVDGIMRPEADVAVITEPSSDIGLGIAQRGAQFFRLKISGAGGQIEVKHDLVNPIGRALEVYRAVEDYSLMRESSVSHPLYDPLYKTKAPVGICRVYGGEWPSTVPDACFMEGSIECMPGEDIETVKESFKKYLLALGLADPWFEKHPVEVRWFGLRLESAELSAVHPLVGEISRHIERVKGHLPIVGGGGGCDLRLPLLHGNTPAVIYGPGGEHAHGIDEYVEFEQVMSCLKVIASLAADWCGKAD